MLRRWRACIVVALDRGTPGERYILGGENLTLKQILDRMSAITGLPSPTMKVPHAVAMAFAFFDENFTGRLRGKEPRATVEAVRMGTEDDVRLLRKGGARARLQGASGLQRVARSHRMVHCAWVRAKAMRIAIIAALPGELKPLVSGWERVPSPTKGISIWVKTAGEDEYIAVCGGMGTAAALRSFAAAEHIGTLDMVLSVGWAGALDEGMQSLDYCYIVSEVIDALTGERSRLTDGKRKLRLVTTPRVADEAEKNRLCEQLRRRIRRHGVLRYRKIGADSQYSHLLLQSRLGWTWCEAAGLQPVY